MVFFAIVLAAGSAIQLAVKTYPQMEGYINLIEGSRLYSKVDINTASLEELTAVAYIGDYTARSIIEHREAAPFQSVDEILSIKGIRKENFDKFSPYLKAGRKKAATRLVPAP